MKKSFKVLIAVSLLGVCASAALATGGSYTMATGGTSGTFYPYGGAMCQIINKAIGTNITANATGGGKENMALLANEETDFALLDADMMSYALTGTESFKDRQINTFGSIASLFPQIFQIVVAENSDIKTVEDLRGKRVSVGDAGSGTAVNAAQLLDAYGMTFNDIKVNYLSFKEAAAAFQDGSLDAYVAVAGMPTTAIVETNLTRKIRLLSIDDEHLKVLTDKYAFFAPVTIGKDVYGTKDEAKSVAVHATVAALKEVDEKVVYDFTKALFDHAAELAEAHAKGRELNRDKAIDGLDPKFLHPGAAKYYKEIGLLK